MKRAPLRFVALAALAALTLTSCAYWNTYYLARKNYDRATLGEPYLIEPGSSGSAQNFTDAIKYSKKLLSQYPKSKWVDAAYLMWARSLIGRQDPLEAVNMLGDYSTRFPQSKLKSDATFYLGVAYRQGHKPDEALTALDEFMAQSPKHSLVPYALLERARALSSLGRRREAAETAGNLISRYPKSDLVRSARITRSDALLADGEFTAAREDFRALGLAATSDEERFGFLLREADCLEGARQYDAEIELLKGALSHETTPIVTTQTTAGGATTLVNTSTGPGADHWGRLRLRIGAAQMLAGRLEPALQEYREVLDSYPRSQLAAEAQYRIGYAYETLGENFDRARNEYGKVKDNPSQGGFLQQATQRMANLDRLASFGKGTGRDSLQRKAEAGFLLAELYLFQHGRTDRALEQYRKIEQDMKGTPWAGKAINAQAWLLRRKLDKKSEADSLFWRVIHEYRATEAQIAARDYLEGEGIPVADSLIERPSVILDTLLRAEPDTLHLTAPPAVMPRLGMPQRAPGDTLARLGLRGMPPGARLPMGAPGDSLRPMFAPGPRFGYPDSLARGKNPAPADTTPGHR